MTAKVNWKTGGGEKLIFDWKHVCDNEICVAVGSVNRNIDSIPLLIAFDLLTFWESFTVFNKNKKIIIETFS